MTLTWPSLRPGRNALPYRCTLTSGNRAARWCTRSSMPMPAPSAGGGAAEHVAHHGERRDRVGAAQRVVEHRPQVLLELAGHRAVHGPVPGVVRAHRELVDHQPVGGVRTRRHLEQLDGQHPDHVQLARRSAGPAGSAAAAVSSSSPGAGAITSTQMPSCCTVCTTGQAAAWPNGDRATTRGEFALQRDERSRRPAGRRRSAGPARRAPRPSRRPRRRGRRTRRAAVFSTTGQPCSVAERGRRRPTGRRPDPARRRPAPARPSSASRARIRALSCANCSASAPGCTACPSATRARMCSPGTCS